MIDKFSMYDQTLQTSGGDVPVYQQELAPAQDDVNWFSDAFSKIGQQGNIGDKVIEQLQTAVNDLQSKREEMNSRQKKATREDDFVDLLTMAREASEYGFKTALMAKVISKSTQSVEKLTNLQ